MRYVTNFGALNPKAGPVKPTSTFRLAVLGDFSGRASRGEVSVGAELGKRKAYEVDVDNLDDLVAKLAPTLRLPLGPEGETVEIELRSMDDFHPDELYDNLEFFEELASLRRQLNSSNWQKAAEKARAMAEASGRAPRRRPRARAHASSVPNAKMSDFARLVGRPRQEAAEATVDQILQSIVGPHVAAARDAEQDALVEAVDEALSGAMRRVLHHPEFQAAESLWRSVELLVRRVETGPDLRIALIDVSAEELAADLASTDTLEETGLYQLLIETPAGDAHAGAFGAILGCYMFDESPPHADLLGRMAQLASAAKAPFLAGITNEVIRRIDKDDHPLVSASWGALRALPQSRYLALACPRFLLRAPYGAKTDPIDPFEFEEFTRREGLGSLLYANGAVLAALLLATNFRQQGTLEKLNLTKALSLGEMPYHYMTDEDGDQIALPCTDRMLSERMMTWVSGRGFMPVLSIRGRPEVRLAGFASLTGDPIAGPWNPVEITAGGGVVEPEREPEPDEDASEPEAEAEAPSADDADDADDADESGSGDDELDALLASLESGGDSDDDSSSDDDESDDDSDDDEMDPELAALLADL